MNDMGDMSTAGLEKTLSADADDENVGIANLQEEKKKYEL